MANNYEKDPAVERVGDVQAAIAAGMAIGEPRVVQMAGGEAQYTVVPEGCELHSLEEFLPRPLRIKQKVELHDPASFIDYVKEFGRNGVSHIFFYGERPGQAAREVEEFVAVLDYHEGAGGVDTPGWCGHVATYPCRRSVEFTDWMERNKKAMSQVDFARFLEDNLPDIVEPKGADLLQIALTLETQKEVTYSSGVRLNNGQVQFQFDEIVRGTSAKGTIEIPEQFTLGIAIHEGGPAYRIPVRLRWRLSDGKVSLWYELVRPHKFVEDAVREMREKIRGQTGITVLSGIAK